MGLHHSGVAACLLLAIGLAVVMLKNDWQREKVGNEYRVSTPMMGGVTKTTISSKLRDGPWPACIGMESSECVTLIESDNSNLKVIVVQDGEYVTEDFRLERVWVFVDEDDLVVKPIPGRG